MVGSEPVVISAREGAVAWLTINRAELGNVINNDVMAALAAGLRAAGEDPAVKAVVLDAAGPDFTMGRDTGAPPPAGPPSPFQMKQGASNLFVGTYRAIQELRVPVIAAVRGKVIGTGAALAGAADVTIAAEDAVFAIPDMEMGVPPLLVMYALLERVPTKRLTYLAYTAKQIDAAAALEIGLVNQVVPVGGLDAALAAFLDQLTGCGAMQIATIKQFLRRARQMDPEAAVDFSANMLAVVNASAAQQGSK